MKLMNAAELRRYAKETFREDFQTDTDAFLDAFQHGAYHEERTDWHGMAGKFSPDELARMWLAICHWLICGSVENRDGKNLQTLMATHDLICRWQMTALKPTDDLYSNLDAVAKLILAESKEGGYWRDITTYFVILNSGIRQRAGVHPIYFSGPVRELESSLG